MTYLTKPMLVVAALALGACTNGGRFDNDTDMGGMGAGGGMNANGAGIGTEALADPASPQYFSQTIGDRVFFEVDQSSLTTSARQILDAQANWLLINADYLARIEGHADEQGTREYNIGLSNKRASAVRDYLIAKGVSASRLETVGYGKERPVAICSDESCYSQNRRSVTILTGGLTG